MIGGDLLLEDFKIHNSNDRTLFVPEHHPISMFSAVNILFCLMSGNDANSFESLFKAGIVNITLVFLGSMILNIVSTSLFVRSWRYNGASNYPEIFHDIFGQGRKRIRFLYIIALLYSTVCNFGSIEDYWYFIQQKFMPKLTYLGSPWFVNYVIIIVCTLPTVLPERFVDLRFYFSIGNIAILLVVLTTCYFLATSVKDQGFDPQKKLVVTSKDYHTMLDGFATFSALFWGQPFLCNIAHNMKESTVNYMINSIRISTILVGIINFTIAITSYFYFWGKTDNDILMHYPKDNVFTWIGIFSSMINCIVTNCGYVSIGTQEFVSMFDESTSKVARAGACIVFICLASLLSVYYTDSHVYIYDLIGDTACMLMSLIIPTFLFVATFKFRSWWGYFSVFHFLLCLSIVICVIVFKFV